MPRPGAQVIHMWNYVIMSCFFLASFPGSPHALTWGPGYPHVELCNHVILASFPGSPHASTLGPGYPHVELCNHVMFLLSLIPRLSPRVNENFSYCNRWKAGWGLGMRLVSSLHLRSVA